MQKENKNDRHKYINKDRKKENIKHKDIQTENNTGINEEGQK